MVGKLDIELGMDDVTDAEVIREAVRWTRATLSATLDLQRLAAEHHETVGL